MVCLIKFFVGLLVFCYIGVVFGVDIVVVFEGLGYFVEWIVELKVVGVIV